MTLKEAIDQVMTPDSKTIQNNINYLDQLGKKLTPEEVQKLAAIKDGMLKQKQQKELEEQNKNKAQQPQNTQIPTTAQNTNTNQTAQINGAQQTAQK